MDIFIKNMVCGRCIKSVTNIFSELGINVTEVQLGKVQTSSTIDDISIHALKTKLLDEGFELIDDQKVKLVEQVKNIIIDLVHYKELDDLKVNLSDYITSIIHKDYHYISNLFSSIENTTIEQFFILQKIEKVKEWLVYNEYTLSEIAWKLGYSSVAHLSAQFKKITGFTPSAFKQLKDHQRKPLDKL